MIPVLIIPTLNRSDMLERCIRSIDHEVGLLVVIDNSGGLTQYQREWFSPLIKKSVFIGHPNAGVAASWNEGIKLFPADYWVLCNDDIEFPPGSLAEFNKAVDEVKDRCAAVVSNVGASLWAVTLRGIIKVGLFDENFYPAYMEDIDWFYRASLQKAPMMKAVNVKVIHGIEGKGSQTISKGLRDENARTYSNNVAYYKEKWGGDLRHEVFTHPFNLEAWPVNLWHFEPHMRRVNQWKI